MLREDQNTSVVRLVNFQCSYNFFLESLQNFNSSIDTFLEGLQNGKGAKQHFWMYFKIQRH